MPEHRFAALAAAALIVGAVGCTAETGSESTGAMREAPHLTRGVFGTMPDGRPVESFTLANGNGIEVTAITYGATIVSLRTPDREGRSGDIVLGYPDLEGYLTDSPYFGAVVGRYGNRIARGRFAIDGQTYQLTVNDGVNHLHGGERGFDKVVWDADTVATDSTVAVTFSYTSPDGEEGYPGTLQARVTYTLNDSNELRVDYEAVTDAPTIVNLTQHSYFNLTGAERNILRHLLEIPADRYTPVDSTLIPTGEIAPVEGTPFDFRMAMPIGERIDADDEQLRRGGGYDHNFVLNRDSAGLALAAQVTEPSTGRTLTITTTEPGIQFYSGNFLDGTITGKEGRVYAHRYGFCLETQHYPDSPNEPGFPSTVLRPGEVYRSTTVFAFGVMH